ncbi:MAG: hypothetical protein EBU90_10845 [Proteobacteria bacterium]|nr:hypothetical protein [Pseudomonadota bacterium]NBP14733.1 hypothetical protein [bacterium]
MKPSLLKIHTLVLLQKDLAKAVEFYELLGGYCAFYQENVWAEFEIEQVKLALCPTDQILDRYSGLVFYIADFKTVSESLLKAGYLLSAPTETINGAVVMVTDPGGNKIELISGKDGQSCSTERRCCSA